jgi:hypothetical protein
MTDDIVTFIKIRLHEDQTAALDALKHWPPGDEIAGQVESILVGAHVQRQNPHRVLRGVKAKRRILDDLHVKITDLEDAIGFEIDRDSSREASDLLLRLLASEWSTHEDYRSEWTPCPTT